MHARCLMHARINGNAYPACRKCSAIVVMKIMVTPNNNYNDLIYSPG